MSAVWTIEGQSGKPWNTTAQTLEFRQIESARLEFRSLDVDTLSLVVIPEDFKTYTTPELGQIVRLNRNGNQFFVGHVTNVRPEINAGSQSITITVSGPWWWMERINYVTQQPDDVGTLATRMTGVFGTASSGTDLQTAIQTAINTMVALGVPMADIAAGSSVASFFQVPRVTLNQGTCAFIITELCRLVPDTIAYFDYNTIGAPLFKVTRRAVATTRTLTIGVDEIESMSINPVFEMKVDQVNLPYVERDVLGRARYNEQSSGTGSPGRVQIITVSGPELDTFLPNDLFDVQPVRTYSNAGEFAVSADPQFSNAIELGLSNQLSISGTYLYYTSVSGIGQASSARTYTVPPAIYKNPDGSLANPSGKFLLLPGNASEWAKDDYGLEPVTVTGTAVFDFYSELTQYNAGGGFISRTTFPLPNWWFEVSFSRVSGGFRGSSFSAQTWDLFAVKFTANGYLSVNPYHWTGSSRTGSGATTLVLATDASSANDFYVGRKITWFKSPTLKYTDTITAYNGSTRTATLSQSWTSLQRPAAGNLYQLDGAPLYRSADYSYIAPPSNLAANLLAAQNFIPYEGQITLVEEVPGSIRYSGKTINIANSLTEHADMRAMVSGETIDLKSGTTVINLGTAPRIDFRTFVDRIRKTPQDNIVFT